MIGSFTQQPATLIGTMLPSRLASGLAGVAKYGAIVAVVFSTVEYYGPSGLLVNYSEPLCLVFSRVFCS